MSGTETGSQPRAAMPLTRGFLFADLRGYTDFVQAHGDAAARDLLQAYRSIVRAIIGRYDGAEIRTEGDSFYVVFPSASGAVRCAIEIVATATDHDPERPIQVGIGIHAGESAEDGEGYVGLAVNIAARICALARAGEILVSDTVRSLTGSSPDLTFTARGRPHLKGVAEPVSVFAVTDARAVPGRVRPPTTLGRQPGRLGILALVGLIAALAVVGAMVVLPRAGSPAPSPSAAGAVAASPSAAPTGTATGTAGPTRPEIPSDGPISIPISDGLAPHVTTPPGTYRTTNFKPAMTFRLSTGWEALIDEPDAFELNRQTSSRGKPDGGLLFSRSRVGYAGPCSSDKPIRLGDTTDAMLDWIEALDFVTLTDPVPVTIGGASGVRLDGVVDTKPASCPDAPTDAQGWYALLSDSRGAIYLEPGEQVGFTVLDVDGQPVLMIADRPAASQADIGHEIDAVLVTVEFE